MQLVGDRTFHPRSYPPVPAQNSTESQPFLSLAERADEWDLQNQAKMQHLERTQPNSQELYERFVQMRETERKQMEARNLVDNPDTRRALDDAIIFVGSCQEMCPVYERVRREFQRNVKHFECENGKISPRLAIKAFSRPAAGQPPALPSDVRPPSVLVQTLKYLLSNIVPALPDSHPFLWDRTRSIRQDFTYQNYAGPEALECTQIICRIHVLCLHLMIGNPDWSQQQEREQLNKSLRTLDEQYALRPNRTIQDCPHEPEIHAYQLLMHIFDAETAYKVESLPQYIVDHPLVQLALRIRALVHPTQYQPSQYYTFFKILREPTTPLLFQIICEVHFPTIRANLMGALNRSLHKTKKAYDISRLATIMGFDDSQEAQEYLSKTKVKIEGNKVHMDTWNDDKFEPVKSRFIDRGLNFNVLSGPQNFDGLGSKASQRQTSFFDPNAIPISKPQPGLTEPRKTAPAATPAAPFNFQTSNTSASPASFAFGSQTNETKTVSIPPAKPTTPPAAPAPPARPTNQEISNFVEQQLCTVAKQLVREAATTAVSKIKQQRLEQKLQRDRYISGLEKQLTSDILQSITRETCFLASKAVMLRRRSLATALVATTHQCAKSALKVWKDKNQAQSTAKEFISTLRNKNAPRRAEPMADLVYSTPTPEPAQQEPKIDEIPVVHASNKELEAIEKAIAVAGHNGAKVITIMADWSTDLGLRIKALFSLGPDYRKTFANGITVSTDSNDRPDITLNFLDHRLSGYISVFPTESFVDRITAQISRYRPVFSPAKSVDMSKDETTEVSLFLPSKRSFSSWAEWGPEDTSGVFLTPKRVSRPRPPINRALSGVQELQKLLQESKQLMN